MVDITGSHLGPYELKAKLGQGGMGTVYRGYQASMDRDVAIKVLPAILAQDPEFIARFRREARTIANLGHARILPVHDYGEQDGTAYLVMRYLDGSTLHERVERDGPLSPEQAVRIVRQVAEGLGYAHGQGIIHRDMTANNIMFDSVGDAYITDFGLAKIIEGAAQLTGSGILGTPAYMSPEQALGDQIDHRADIYALGVVLFEMMTGEVPFTGSSAMAIVVKHINEPLPDPREKRPDLADGIADVIFRATAKDPGMRFQSCLEFANALDAAIKAGPAGMDTTPPRVFQPGQATHKLSQTTPVRSAPETSGIPGWVIPTAVIAGVIVVAVGILLALQPGRGGIASAPTPTLMVLPTTAATSQPTLPGGPPPASPPPDNGGAPAQPGGAGQGQGGQFPSGPEGGPRSILSPDPDLIECPDGRMLILAHDFKDSRIEGMNLFAEESRFVRLQGDALIVQPIDDGLPLPILSGPAMQNPYVWLRATWPDGPGVLAVTLAFDRQTNNAYNIVVDGGRGTIRIDKNRILLLEEPLSVSPFDASPHELSFAILNTTISAAVDGQTLTTFDDPTPLPAGLIHLYEGTSTLNVDAFGVCGSR